MHGPVRLSPGTVFAQDFEIRAQLAEGGMGTVYAVIDRTCGEERALKVLLPELVTDESTRRRFTQEAEIASQIETAHVPRIFRSGIDEAGVPWILMELLRGRDLRRYVKDNGPFRVEDAQPLIEQLCDALAAAHRKGLVHRDLKPENVFLADRAGGGFDVKLLDFGVAKVIDMHRTSGVGTGAIGSPLWMAPEQTAKGGRIAPSTDVFALALVTFYFMTGAFYWKSAQDGSGVGGLLRELHVDDPEPPSVRARELGKPAPFWPSFDAWFLRAIARSNTERFRDAGEAFDALRIAFARRPNEQSAMAFAQTLEVPAPQGQNVATGPIGNPPIAALRGPASEERHDTVPENAFDPNAIPPTDPPDPMPVPAPMPEIPGPAPMPHYVAPAPQRSSLLVWIVALLGAGLVTAAVSGAIVWLALTFFSREGDPSPPPHVSEPAMVVPTPVEPTPQPQQPTTHVVEGQVYRGVVSCGRAYPATLSIVARNGTEVRAELSMQSEPAIVQQLAGSYTEIDRRLVLRTDDGPIRQLAGQIEEGTTNLRGEAIGTSRCSGGFALALP